MLARRRVAGARIEFGDGGRVIYARPYYEPADRDQLPFSEETRVSGYLYALVHVYACNNRNSLTIVRDWNLPSHEIFVD